MLDLWHHSQKTVTNLEQTNEEPLSAARCAEFAGATA